MSHNQLRNAPPNLLFLHGFLGCPDDWSPLLKHLPKKGLVQTPSLFSIPLPKEPTIVIGYSMGGRIALMLLEKYPALFSKAIVIAAHPGLASAKEREERLQRDLALAKRLEEEPLPHFLEQWYNQPLFASLRKKRALFDALMLRRGKIDSKKFAALLRQYSLGKQSILKKTLKKAHYLYGDEDTKYKAFAPFFCQSDAIATSGHCPHLENPKETAEALALAIK